jgi:polyhydroxyalkanoate synthase subunit PhaC
MAVEQSPLETWNKLIENTWNLNGAKVEAKEAEQAIEVIEDPWLRMIDQLWQLNPYSKLIPIDPAQNILAMQRVWLNSMLDSTRTWNDYVDFVQRYNQLMAATTLKLMNPRKSVEPVINPEKGDKRFNAPAWTENPFFDALKQTYLLTAATMLKTASEVQGLNEHQKRKMLFYVHQFLDAISPTNFAFTNPEVIEEYIRTGGENLVKGMENLLRDIREGQIKMTDTEAFRPGRNLAITPGQVVYRNKLIELIQYAPTTEQVYSIPLLFIPPWINKYYVLDLRPENSMVKFLVDNGLTVFVISWKNPDPSMENTTFEDYLKLGPVTALNVIKEITGSPKVNVVGYCIGGTLLSMALPYLKAKGDETVNAASFFVALQDFSEVGETSVFIDEPQVRYMEAQMMDRGYLPARSMAAMFNMLRDNDLIWSNVVNNYLLGKDPPAFDLLYWNNDGTRMARAAHSFYLRNTYLENNLIKPGKIVLDGVPIDLKEIEQDVFAVGAIQDHIVPWQSAWRITQLVGGRSQFVLAASGHIAGIINPPSKGRGYWTNDKSVAGPRQWLEKAVHHDGSWWTYWLEWLKPRSGEKVEPPPLGGEAHPPITPAPGTYVLEK